MTEFQKWFLPFWMEFMCYRVAMWQECPCTDRSCDKHRGPVYFK